MIPSNSADWDQRSWVFKPVTTTPRASERPCRPLVMVELQALPGVMESPPPATCRRGYGWRGPGLPLRPWSGVAEQRQ